MRLASLILAAAAALVVTPCLRAQVTLETNSGNSYTGTVVSNDGQSVELEADGKKLKLPIESLTLVSQYRLEKAKTGDDAKSQLALAEWCVPKTLYEQARTHYRKALAADALMADEINAKVVVARKTAANELLQRGKTLQAAGNGKEARRVWSELVKELPLEPAADEARKLLAEDTTQRKRSALSAPKPAAAAKADGDVPLRANGEPFSEATRKLFQPVIDSYHKMLDATQDGLAQGSGDGIKEFEKALKEGEKIRKTADKLKPQAAGNEEVAEALERVDSKLEDATVDARINLVDCYLMRTSYNQASDVVREGLAQYPKNEQLRQAMNRVTAAAADGLGGDWVVIRG
jgi:tetratricopeptide (TPR) repeat protein